MARSRAQGRQKKQKEVSADGILETKKQRKKRLQREAKENDHNKNDTSENAGPEGKKTYTVDQLLEKAENLLANFQYDLALKFCEKALESSGGNSEGALVGAGEVCAECGRMEEARNYFQRAIANHPNSTNYTKYLELAQLLSGKEAEQQYVEGLQRMEHPPAESAGASSSATTVSNREISEVYCALGEIYLTDLCEEEEAEKKCEEYFSKGISADNTNPTAHQGIASFYISSERKQEAVTAVKKSLDLWFPKFQKVLQESSENPEDSEVQLDCELDFEKRKECAKLLTELELFEEAEGVLDTLAAENDEEIEVWYMYGWVNYLRGGEHKGHAKAYFSNVQELIAANSELNQEEEVRAILSHVTQLMKELESVSIPEDKPEEENNDMDTDK